MHRIFSAVAHTLLALTLTNAALATEENLLPKHFHFPAHNSSGLLSLDGENIALGASFDRRQSDYSHQEEAGVLSADLQSETRNISEAQVAETQVSSGQLRLNARNTLRIEGVDIDTSEFEARYETLILQSLRNSRSEQYSSDDSGVLVRTLASGGSISEEEVLANINAERITLNGTALVEQQLSSATLLETLQANNSDLSTEQIQALRVSLTNDQWHEESKTLSQMGSVLVQAVVSYFTAGAGSGLIEVSNGAAQAMIDRAVGSMIQQVSTELATSAITGEAPKLDMESMFDSALKSAALQGVSNALDSRLGFVDETGKALEDLSLVQQSQQTLAHSLAQTAINGGDLESTLASNFASQAAASIANTIGDAKEDGSLNTLSYNSAHAALGCALAEAQGGDCESGALGAVVGENIAIAVEALSKKDQFKDEEILLFGQIGSVLVAGGIDPNSAMSAASNAVTNNYLKHDEAQEYLTLEEEIGDLRAQCQEIECTAAELEQVRSQIADKRQRIRELRQLDQKRDDELRVACTTPSTKDCRDKVAELNAAWAEYRSQQGSDQVELARFERDVESQLYYSARIQNPDSFNNAYGALQLVNETVSGTAALAEISAKAALGDENAQRQLAQITDAAIETLRNIEDIPANVVAAYQEEQTRIQALEDSGAHDLAQQARAQLAVTVAGSVTGAVALGKATVSLTKTVASPSRNVAVLVGGQLVGATVVVKDGVKHYLDALGNEVKPDADWVDPLKFDVDAEAGFGEGLGNRFDYSEVQNPERFDFDVNKDGIPYEYLNTLSEAMGVSVKHFEDKYISDEMKGVDYKNLIQSFVDNNEYGLDLKDAHLIMGYTTNFFQKDLNWPLVMGEMISTAKVNLINDINDALLKLPPDPGKYIRGLGAVGSEYNEKYSYGNRVFEMHFSSISKELAENYPRNNIMIFHSNSARDISDLAMDVQFADKIGQTPTKSEHVIPANSRFEITNVEENITTLTEE